jgi:hypothetical protein
MKAEFLSSLLQLQQIKYPSAQKTNPENLTTKNESTVLLTTKC